MADHLGGDALAHLAFSLRVDWQGEIGVRLDVDEAGRYREARQVDLALGGTGNVSDGCDPVVINGQIATCPEHAAAVVERAAAQHEVKTYAVNAPRSCRMPAALTILCQRLLSASI
jgi:hypothetical protein